MIKVLITDDHELYTEGLVLLLNKQPGITVTGALSSGKALLAVLPDTDADLLLLDLYLTDYEPEQLIQEIRRLRPTLKVIYLTMIRGTRYVHKLLKYTIQGYLLKSATVEELTTAIHDVQNGKTVFSREIDIQDKAGELRQMINIHDNKTGEILTPREIQILELICKEYSNAEIAHKLFLSISTVETHRKRIISKLGVNNTVGLVKFALKNHIIE
jgi:two-component system, NarL family, response regulator NreC